MRKGSEARHRWPHTLVLSMTDSNVNGNKIKVTKGPEPEQDNLEVWGRHKWSRLIATLDTAYCHRPEYKLRSLKVVGSYYWLWIR